MAIWTLKIGGSAIDEVAKKVTLDKLRVDARVSDALTFTEVARHFDGTWAEGAAVVLEYPTGTVRFTGRISERESIGTSGAEQVRYTAVGWRALAQNVMVARSASDSYPERIYNAADDDIDKAYRALGPSATVGAIITDLFDTFLTALRAEGACHASSTPYVSGELSSLTFVPGKLVLAGMNFDQAISAVLAEQGPAWSWWVDTAGAYHVYDRSASTATTVTIADDRVVSNQLRRHVRGRFTAVKVVGKRGRGQEVWPTAIGVGTDEYGQALSGVTEVWASGLEAAWTMRLGEGQREYGYVSVVGSSTFTVGGGKAWAVDAFSGGYAFFPRYSLKTAFTVDGNTADTITFTSAVPGVNVGDPILIIAPGLYSDVHRLFQITDATKRDIVQEGAGEVDCCPHILAILRNSAGAVVGTQQIPVRLEGDGKFRALQPMITSFADGLVAGQATPMEDWKFVYCYRPASTTTPILARYPSSSYSGGASAAPWSIQRELTAVVEEFEDASAPSAYATLAQEIHKVTSTVGTSGKLVLAELDPTWFDPRRRVHIAHASDTTGWEALGAFLTSVTYDFMRATTELELSEDGGSEGVNYQSMLEAIRSRMRGAGAGLEAKKLGDFINCRGEERRRGSYSSRANELEEGSRPKTATLVEPVFRFPRAGADFKTSARCRCDEETDPCLTPTQAASFAKKQFICLPDDRHGLTVRHQLAGGFYCSASQLAYKYDQGSGSYVPGGNYYPFVCQQLEIGEAPDGTSGSGYFTGTCTNGMRELVVVEPFDLDDGDNGTQVGVGSFLIQFLAAYDNYMQHNEEAHCCLDNRIYSQDRAIWGPVDSSMSGCQNTILDLIQAIDQKFTTFGQCMNANWQRGWTRGETKGVYCPLPSIVMDLEGCGGC